MRQGASTIITNYFNAPSNIANHSPGAQLTVQPPAVGDVNGLITYLSAVGLSPLQLAALREAIAEDNANGSASMGRWERVRAWFGPAMTDVGTGAVGSAVATAASAFLGGLGWECISRRGQNTLSLTELLGVPPRVLPAPVCRVT